MKRILVAATIAALVTLSLTFVVSAAPQTKSGNGVPHYVVDPLWPKDLPEDWTLGQVANVAVDGQDNVWIVQRPRTLVDDEKGAQKDPPETRCCKPAPLNRTSPHANTPGTLVSSR